MIKFVEVGQLIAGRQNGNPGTPEDFDLAGTHRRQYTDLARSQVTAARQHRVARAQILTAEAQVPARVHRIDDQYVAGITRPRVFDADHGIRSVRDRRAGHDARGISGPNRVLREIACRHTFNDAQSYGRVFTGCNHIRKARGKAIHRTVVPGRLIDRRFDGGGKRALHRFG